MTRCSRRPTYGWNLTRTRNFEGDILISPCDLGGSGNVEGINLILPSALGDSGIIATAAPSRSSGPQNRLQEGRLIPGLRKRPRPRSFPGSRLVAFAGRGSPSRLRDRPPTHNRTVVMPGSRWGRKPVGSGSGRSQTEFEVNLKLGLT